LNEISRPTMLMSRRRRGLVYFTLHAAKQGVAVPYVMKIVEF